MTNRIFLAFGWLLLFSTTMKHTNNFLSRLSVRGIGWLPLTLSFLVLVAYCASATAQTTAFTYQGKLADNGNPVTGYYDFEFRLTDTGGTQQGSTVPLTNVYVDKGIFTVQLDFIACATCVPCPTCFNGLDRFLDISLRPTGVGAFTPLTPRQPLTSNPYAIKSRNALSADGLGGACVNCVTSTQIASVTGSAVTGTIPVASVPAGSANYIQNTTTPQPGAFFDIGGSGHIVGTLRLEGSGIFLPDTPILSLSSNGIFQIDAPFLPSGRFVVLENGNVGIGNGAPAEKLYVAGNGSFTGNVNTGTQYNIGGTRAFIIYDPQGLGATDTFVGSLAGLQNTFGRFNSFFGCGAGQSNTSGTGNSFFGCGAGGNNTLGGENTFVGRNAGFANTASENSFFGSSAGAANALGFSNSFFGKDAGKANTNGVENTFFGKSAGESNTLGNHNSFFGDVAGQSNTTEQNNTFIGYNAGAGNGTNDSGNTANNNTFVGVHAGLSNQTGSKNTALGAAANVGSGNLTNATAIGADAIVTQSNSLVLGSSGTNVGIGTSAPTQRLEVSGNAQISQNLQVSFLGVAATPPTTERLRVGGIIRVDGLGSLSPTGAPLCLNNSNQISPCPPSSIRYKSNVSSYGPGLGMVKRLRPVSFNWKVDGTADFGLVAEEVAEIEPLLVTHNNKGGIEGVKYDRVGVVLINAIKEQQAQITDLQNQLKQQRLLNEIELRRINALAKLVRLNRAKNPRRRSLPHLAKPR